MQLPQSASARARAALSTAKAHHAQSIALSTAHLCASRTHTHPHPKQTCRWCRAIEQQKMQHVLLVACELGRALGGVGFDTLHVLQVGGAALGARVCVCQSETSALQMAFFSFAVCARTRCACSISVRCSDAVYECRSIALSCEPPPLCSLVCAVRWGIVPRLHYSARSLCVCVCAWLRGRASIF